MADFDIKVGGSKKLPIHRMYVGSEDDKYTVIHLFTKRDRDIGCCVYYLQDGILYSKFFDSDNKYLKFMDKLKSDNGWT